MITLDMTVHFDKGYIAEPYWPALDKVINIQKASGMNRAKSTANRRKALEEHLQSIGMTAADYELLEKQSREPFYRDDAGEIIVPEIHILSFLVQTFSEIRAAAKPCKPEQVHSRFTVTPWSTGQKKEAGIWERFVLVTSGTGQTLSNQRGLRRSSYIANCDAQGTISFAEEFIDGATLQRAIEWGGQHVGIGAARKMGWGRFTVQFKPR